MMGRAKSDPLGYGGVGVGDVVSRWGEVERQSAIRVYFEKISLKSSEP